MPHLHGHAAALQGDAAAIRDLAALDGLVGIAVGIAVVGLIAGRQIYFSHCQCRTDGLYLVVIGVTRVGLAVGVICGCGGAKECIGAVLGPAAVYIVLAGSIHSIPLDVGLAGRRPVICLHHRSCTAAGDGHRSAEGGVGAIGSQSLHLVVIGVSGVGLVIGIICGRGGANVFICAIAAAAAVHLILAGSVHSTPIDIGLAGGGQIVRCHHRSCAAAGDSHCGAEGGVGAIGSQSLHLVVIGGTGVSLAVRVVQICGRAQERISAVLGGAAIHIVPVGSVHSTPIDIGLATGAHIAGLRGGGHRGLFAFAMPVRLQESVIAVVNRNGIPLSLAAAVIYVSQARAARKSHIPDVGHALRDLDAGQARAAVERTMPDGSRAAADGHTGQTRAILENVVGNALHAVSERHLQPIAGAERILRALCRPGVIVNLHQALAVQKCIVPNAGHITADGHTGQALTVAEKVAGDLLHAFAEYHLHPAHGGSGTAECTAQASQIRCRPGVVADLLQVIAPEKCAVAQSGHARRDLYSGHAIAVGKGILPDAGHAAGEHYAGQARAAAECAVPNVGHTAAHGHAGQTRTAVECRGPDAGHAVPDHSRLCLVSPRGSGNFLSAGRIGFRFIVRHLSRAGDGQQARAVQRPGDVASIFAAVSGVNDGRLRRRHAAHTKD